MTGKGWVPGVATNAVGKPRHMVGRPFNQRTLSPPTTQVDCNDCAANREEFLPAAPQERPWSFWFGCREPHRDYEYRSGVVKGGKKLTEVPRGPGFWPDNAAVRNGLLDYANEVEHFDQQLRTRAKAVRNQQEEDGIVTLVM